MKVIFFLIVIMIIVTCSGEDPPSTSSTLTKEERKHKRLEKRIRKCGFLIGLSSEDHLKYRALDFENPSPKLKCFAQCMLEKMHIMKDGDFAPPSQVPDDKKIATDEEREMRESVDICRKVKATDGCDKAFEFVNCLKDKGLAVHA